MLNTTLLFLLGDKRPFHDSEDLLTNILDRLSLSIASYDIAYCYNFTLPSRKKERLQYIIARRNQLIDDWKDKDVVIVGMGWKAIELLTNVGKNKTSRVIGCRFPIVPFKFDAWFTYDPAAALYDPNMYVDIMAVCSAAIRYSGRQIVIDIKVKPYDWPNI